MTKKLTEIQTAALRLAKVITAELLELEKTKFQFNTHRRLSASSAVYSSATVDRRSGHINL